MLEAAKRPVFGPTTALTTQGKVVCRVLPCQGESEMPRVVVLPRGEWFFILFAGCQKRRTRPCVILAERAWTHAESNQTTSFWRIDSPPLPASTPPGTVQDLCQRAGQPPR